MPWPLNWDLGGRASWLSKHLLINRAFSNRNSISSEISICLSEEHWIKQCFSPRSGLLNHKLSKVFSLMCTFGNLNIHPSKKVTQHDFDRLYMYIFYPGFLFIKLDIPRKPVYLPFDWCLICYDCFIGARVGWANWGQYKKGNVAKLIGLYRNCMLCEVLHFPFVNVCTRGYPLPIQCAKVSEDFGAMNRQWVRVHTTQNLT